tara:strand:+ start:411 stop:587 length:177 start_codon:yes stop_codon:yes gene_type:complete
MFIMESLLQWILYFSISFLVIIAWGFQFLVMAEATGYRKVSEQPLTSSDSSTGASYAW